MARYYTGTFGNPSSIHSFGREAKAVVEDSRGRISSLIGARDSEICFTSGGTESDNAAIFGTVAKYSSGVNNHIIISAIEHHAVLHAAESLRQKGFDVTLIPVDSTGMVSPSSLRDAITKRTFLVSIIHANNEIGTIQNLPELVKVAHDSGVIFHTDAVQSFCKTRIDVNELGVDLASFTAHKIYGPKGIGALYIRRGVEFEPLLHGGAQERNRRAGTESVPLAAGFAKAAELAAEEIEAEASRLSKLNSLLRRSISSVCAGRSLQFADRKLTAEYSQCFNR